MAALVCSLSGTTPEEPVFSRTGYIFEKRIIEKYLKSNGDTCPVTGDALTIDDLVPIKANKSVKPRPVTATSIPGLLGLMQNEWDSLMAETFSLRSHLDIVRKQLSHSLYQHDAACRVIARLMKERDSLRMQLSQLQENWSRTAARDSSLAGPGDEASGPSEIGLSPEMLDEWNILAKSLLSQRKKRTTEGLLPVEQVKEWKLKGSFSIHSSTMPGVTSVVQAPFNRGRQAWTAGVDGVVTLFDITEQKTLARLLGHLRKVNQVIPHPSEHIVLSASDDKTVRVWGSSDGSEGDYRVSWILRRHRKAVTSISLHPSGSCFTSCSKDGTWGLHDLYSGQTYQMQNDAPCEFTTLSFHPDGLLLGASGVDGNLYVYHVKDARNPMVSLAAHERGVTHLQFSENGYYLASCGADGKVRLWDLRKTSNIDTIEPLTESSTTFVPAKLSFDNSGNYLAIAGSSRGSKERGHLSVHRFESKTKLQPAICLEGHTDVVTDASFGPNAEYLLSSSMDRTVRLWSK